jgi:hypothetical protein
MAKAFPNSQFIGYDFHPNSIEHAAAHAKEHGVTANTHFEVATAKGRNLIWSPFSIACMTWAIQRAQRRTCSNH